MQDTKRKNMSIEIAKESPKPKTMQNYARNLGIESSAKERFQNKTNNSCYTEKSKACNHTITQKTSFLSKTHHKLTSNYSKKTTQMTLETN